MLGITNWVLSGNAIMNPWIHLQTESTFFKAVTDGTALVAECSIDDLFEKKGHEFVDAIVNVFEVSTNEPVMQARLRAIYQLRGAEAR